mmetsp:Transcript_12993/g.40005  ORF Transcript_12993/g.40005 Transcript_12993/m.40005 type:complete len:92 (+) Transcript_12993:51-326(+)
MSANVWYLVAPMTRSKFIVVWYMLHGVGFVLTVESYSKHMGTVRTFSSVTTKLRTCVDEKSLIYIQTLRELNSLHAVLCDMQRMQKVSLSH